MGTEATGSDPCRDHVGRYLQAPELADCARRGHPDDLYGEELWPDVTTPGVPPSLRRALEEWVTQESTPDSEVADFLGWPVARVRELR